MSRFWETLIFILGVILAIVCIGCGEYRPPIIDIRDEPTVIDWSPRQPEKFAKTIMEYRP
jgi:hypothetical protein